MKLRAKIILTTASLALSCALLAKLRFFFRFYRFFCRVL